MPITFVPETGRQFRRPTIDPNRKERRKKEKRESNFLFSLDTIGRTATLQQERRRLILDAIRKEKRKEQQASTVVE